jgi:hypothetical protein
LYRVSLLSTQKAPEAEFTKQLQEEFKALEQEFNVKHS